MVRQLKKEKVKYKKRIIASSFLLAIIFLFLSAIILSLFLPREEKFNKKIRLPIQEEIIKSIGEYTIENDQVMSYINTDYQIIEGQNNISINEIKRYSKKLMPGDIFFTSSGKYLSGFFIPGKWKHAGIYLGTKEQVEKTFKTNPSLYNNFLKYYKSKDDILILDSSAEGVKIRKIEAISNLSSESYLKSFTAFRINKNPREVQKFLLKAMDLLGKEYDYDMNTGDEAYIYCSELIYHSLKEINITIDSKQKILNREIISPNDLLYYIVKSKKISNDFSFVFFIEKENGFIKNLSRSNLITELKP